MDSFCLSCALKLGGRLCGYRGAALGDIGHHLSVSVAGDIIEMYRDKDRAQGEELAEQISAQVAQEIIPYVDGFYLITPFKRVELILRIIKQIRGLLDR